MEPLASCSNESDDEVEIVESMLPPQRSHRNDSDDEVEIVESPLQRKHVDDVEDNEEDRLWVQLNQKMLDFERRWLEDERKARKREEEEEEEEEDEMDIYA